MHLLFLLGLLINLLSILAPAFSSPIIGLHCASSYHDLHVVLILLSFDKFSYMHMHTWVQVATTLDYLIVCSRKHLEVSQLP